MTTTLGKRIKIARTVANLSQQALADAISDKGDGNISRTAIAQWESGVTKRVEAANLLRAAQVLNIRPEWMQFGTGSMRPSPDSDNQDITSNALFIPILSSNQAINVMEHNNDASYYIGLDQELAKVASSQAFALIVACDSMAPTLKLGDIVIIDPAIKPKPGEIVAAKLPGELLVILRKYRPLTNPSGETFVPFELIPLNEDWPRITIHNQNQGSIVGTLIEHRCRRRITSTKENGAKS